MIVLTTDIVPKRLFRKLLLLFLTCVTLTGCTEEEEVDTPVESAGAPIFQADPSIFLKDGMYYLYGTNDRSPDAGFITYSSTDLENWKSEGTVLRKGESFGDWGFWAPQVWSQGGKFYMAYTANEKIAIAESTSPKGPFKQTNQTALPSSFNQIDPFIFLDDDGKKYLFHVRLENGNKIYMAELKDDLSGIVPGTYKHCLSALPQTWEDVSNASWRVAEGPSIIKHEGLYYLFYSANDFRNMDYAVGYAVSASIHGPWVRYEGNPIINRATTAKLGNGHGDVFKGKDNNIYYVFHTHFSSASVGPRKTALLKLNVKKDANGKNVFEADKNSFRYLGFSN